MRPQTRLPKRPALCVINAQASKHRADRPEENKPQVLQKNPKIPKCSEAEALCQDRCLAQVLPQGPALALQAACFFRLRSSQISPTCWTGVSLTRNHLGLHGVPSDSTAESMLAERRISPAELSDIATLCYARRCNIWPDTVLTKP